MKDIINIERTKINGAETNSVNSRELYEKLGLAKGQYTRWITKNLIDDGFFIQDEDFIGVRQDVEGNIVSSFIITIDTAKHLSMMSRTKKGKEIRDYFIQVEKDSKQTNLLPQNYIEALKALTAAEEQKLQLAHKIDEKDKIILAVAELNIKVGQVSFAQFAKNLAIKDFGRNHVIKFCKARNYIMDNREPYQPYVNRGYFTSKPSKEKINGEYRYTTFLTPRGSVWLAKIIKAELEIDEAA